MSHRSAIVGRGRRGTGEAAHPREHGLAIPAPPALRAVWRSRSSSISSEGTAFARQRSSGSGRRGDARRLGRAARGERSWRRRHPHHASKQQRETDW